MYRNFWSNMHIILKLKSLIKSKHLLYIILNKNKLRSITLVKKTYEIRFKLLRPANDSYTIRNFHRKTFPNTKKPSNEKNQIPSKNKQLSFHSTLSAVSHFIHTNVIALESSSEKLTRFFVTFDEREPVDPGLAVSWTRLSSVSSIFERSSRKKSNPSIFWSFSIGHLSLRSLGFVSDLDCLKFKDFYHYNIITFKY